MTAITPSDWPFDTPDWPLCDHAAGSSADVRCRGRQVEPYTACFAHLADADRISYLAALRPGADFDHRGTELTGAVLAEMLARLTDHEAGHVRIGSVLFDQTEITGDVSFDGAKITGGLSFYGASITGEVSFDEVEVSGGVSFLRAKITGDASFCKMKIGGKARFTWAEIGGDVHFDGSEIGEAIEFHELKVTGDASFSEVKISGDVWFSNSEIDGDILFNEAKIGGNARFGEMKVGGDAWFSDSEISGRGGFEEVEIAGDAVFFRAKIRGSLTFDKAKIGGDAVFLQAVTEGNVRCGGVRISGDAVFHGLQIDGYATFYKAVFERASEVGPLVSTGTVDFSEALFASAVTIEVAAASLLCQRTRWASTAALRLRYAAVDLTDAVMEYPVSVASRSRPFTVDDQNVAESGLTDETVQITSLRGVDAAHLVLTDIDVSGCLFAGTIHLDQLRMEGSCTLADAPSGVRRNRRWPIRWTPRRTLTEEHHWRATRSNAADGWEPAPEGVEVLKPTALAPVYRQLRKAFEDGKNEPGAADFYYGEMEMRRHDRGTPRSERGLLTLYWAVSGYGLRASRALTWLLLAITVTMLVMMLWGIPQEDPKPFSAGSLRGQEITLSTDTPDPVNPEGPLHERLSTERFEKSLRVVINSVVFRSSGQDLTTTGTYAEMISRLTEPVLAGLAVLAVRARVRR